MTTRQQIIETARTWVGTPYHHQGRVKGVGVDCCGLVIGVAKELGLSTFDVDGYSRDAQGVSFLLEFQRNCEPTDDPKPGDILCFKIKDNPQHCGIMAEKQDKITLIHAYYSTAITKCIEHIYDDWWARRLIQAFKFPGVSND